jgi:hypothetical protein
VPTQEKPRGKPLFTASELQGAILVDYEGNKPAPGARQHPPPTLLGYLIDGQEAAGIIETQFAERCAAKYKAKHVVREDHAGLVRRLVAQAETEGRVIISWSEHDLKHMVRAVPEMRARLLAVHRNAIKPVRRYLRERGIQLKRGEAKLYRVCEILGIPVVDKYGEGLVGEGLSMIRKQLEAGKAYGALSKGAQRAWQNIVKHNRQDLLTMKAVLDYALATPVLTPPPASAAW